MSTHTKPIKILRRRHQNYVKNGPGRKIGHRINFFRNPPHFDNPQYLYGPLRQRWIQRLNCQKNKIRKERRQKCRLYLRDKSYEILYRYSRRIKNRQRHAKTVRTLPTDSSRKGPDTNENSYASVRYCMHDFVRFSNIQDHKKFDQTKLKNEPEVHPHKDQTYLHDAMKENRRTIFKTCHSPHCNSFKYFRKRSVPPMSKRTPCKIEKLHAQVD